nr:SGNH/GDSL hydrolase family protein [uncultured Flavobacterium sp.]
MNKKIIIALLLIVTKIFSQEMKTDWANISKYSKENQTLKLDKTSENRIVFIGNSITEGWKISDPDFFSNKNYINRGISGQTSSQMLVRFRPDVIALKPKLVVILAGINDIAQNNGPIALEDIFGNIISMVELAKQNKIGVILSSVLPAYDFAWRKGLEPAEKVIKLNSMIKNYCEENQIVYVDYFSAMVDQRNGLDEKYTQDGVHPTLVGYKTMEPLLEKAIRKALK